MELYNIAKLIILFFHDRLMFKSTSGWIKSLIPSYKKEDIGWDKQNFLEWLFFLIIDHIFINVNKILKISPISYPRDQDSLLPRLVNTIIIFLHTPQLKAL